MDYLHSYKYDNFGYKLCVINQCRNIPPLYLLMAFCYWLPILVKATFPTGFVWSVKLTDYLIWHVFIHFRIHVPCSIVPSFFLTVVFITSGYLATKYIFFHNSMRTKILRQTWYLLSVIIIYLLFPYFKRGQAASTKVLG